MNEVLEGEPVECPTCGMPFLSDDSVINHYNRIHQRANSSRRPYRCAECDDWTIKAPYATGENTFCSSTCRGQFQSRERSGENHPNWKGGISSRGRRWEYIAWHIRRRDGACRICGRTRTQNGHRLHVHHIVPETDVPDDLGPHTPANLVSLCGRCHQQVEGWAIPRQLAVYDVTSLREFVFDRTQRAAVNKLITENCAPRYDQLTKKRSQEFIQRYDPNQSCLDEFTGTPLD